MGLLSGWPLFFQRLLTKLCFMLLRFIYMTIQKVYWKINGTAERIRESRRPENYRRCAHVLDILHINIFDFTRNSSIKDYILSHNRFDDPQYIFDNDHVSLITINEENAVFGVAKKKGMHLWKFEYSSFIRMAHALHCNQLILVPLNHFHRMAEELGDPKGQLILLVSTGRCGSTLLTQMMQTSGKCISISEPDSTSALALWYRDKGDSPQLRQLSKDVVRWTCRPYKDFTPLAYMLKITPLYGYIFPILKEVYPKSRCLYMYRNPVNMSQSFYRLARETPSFMMLITFAKLSPWFAEKGFDYVGFNGKNFRYKFWDDLSLFIVRAAVYAKLYLEFRRSGLDISAVRYEDIVKDKQFAARAILKFCGLPMSLEADFLRGLEVDSQRNSTGSRTLLAKHRVPPLSLESERLANKVLEENDLPIIGEDWLLEDTITYS